MTIYGTAALAFCLICGLLIGRFLGNLMGLDIDVGGVGIAMILLMFVSESLRKRGLMKEQSVSGINYWSAIYIPIVVAMAASQNVHSAITGGTAALLAGTLAVAACFALVPIVTRIGGSVKPPEQ